MNAQREPWQFRTAPGASRRSSFWRRPVLSACLFPIGLLLLRGACGAAPAAGADLPALKRAVVSNYAAMVSASYLDTLSSAKKLESAITVFLAEPSEKSLEAARQAWCAAHQRYSLTETHRFYDGPIDQVEALINSWPIDENYIDYVKDDPDAGIINAVAQFPSLSTNLIVSLNGKEGKKNISAGFHAIEFLLWGQPPAAGGAGTRSWRDYAAGAKNAERRRAYLRFITELLLDNLQTVAAEWTAGDPRNYRAQFLALDPDAALAKILKGMGALSGPELSGERLTSAYETKEREEQQDCFSDNSCEDLVADAVGIQNVFLGHYTSLTGSQAAGPGLLDLLARVDPVFAAKLKAQIETAVASTRDIPPPFDQAILGTDKSPGRIAIKNAIRALQTQSDMIAEAAKVLSIRLNI